RSTHLQNKKGTQLTAKPKGVGSDDVLGIHYEFDFQGVNARIEILDRQGRRVRVLQENVLLSPEPGSFFWDGTDSRGNRAPVGPYIIVMEVSRADSGERLIFREVCVLADRF
ncbi:MAG: FlgD immunoglobulin-like domain containing protein, partial [Bacteroidota bacterium]